MICNYSAPRVSGGAEQLLLFENMDNRMTTDQKEIRTSVRHTGKAWRYIHDVTNTNAGNLNRKALVDGSRQYTYGLMFHEWERYASVFSALGITGENHSRVGLLGSTSAETVFTIYGLIYPGGGHTSQRKR